VVGRGCAESDRAGSGWYVEVSICYLGPTTSADLSDNNEYFLHDDEFLCKNQMPMEMASPAEGPTTVGLMGRMLNVRLLIC